LEGELNGLAGQFPGSGDRGGFHAGQDLPVGGFVGSLLQLASQQEGLFKEEGFQWRASFKGTAHKGLLPKKPSQ
jgi:hypothetical protein